MKNDSEVVMATETATNLASTHWIERTQFLALSAPESVPMPPFENAGSVAGGGYAFALCDSPRPSVQGIQRRQKYQKDFKHDF